MEFAVPNFSGEVVQITGRAANVNDVECDPLLAIVTRWQIGGSGTAETAETAAPPTPIFGVGAGQRGGVVELSGVSFSDLTNTRSISSATLTLYYWDELQTLPAIALANDISPNDESLNLTSAGSALPKMLQIDAEVMQVAAVGQDGLQYQVTRGMDGSQAASHQAGTPVYQLLSKTVIAPFPPDFFGSGYSGGWSYPVLLPNARVATAELFVTNDRGKSPIASCCLTGVESNGLRTLSGGQVDLSVDGILAIESDAVPAASLSQSSSVKDIFAKVEQPPVGSPLSCVVKVNGEAIPVLTIEGEPISNTIDITSDPGVCGLKILAGQPITLDITAVGSTYPGKRLTATIRL